MNVKVPVGFFGAWLASPVIDNYELHSIKLTGCFAFIIPILCMFDSCEA